MNHARLGILVTIVVLIGATSISYLALDSYYGQGSVGGEDSVDVQMDTERYSLPEQIDVFPISIAIGASMAVISAISWSGSTKVSGNMVELQGSATSVLLNEGLDDMTVRDVEIVSRMMVKKEFTIPELLSDSQVSRSSIWKLVKKMVSTGLVEKTDEEKLPKSGRGKPSQVYRYVGPESL